MIELRLRLKETKKGTVRIDLVTHDVDHPTKAETDIAVAFQKGVANSITNTMKRTGKGCLVVIDK